MTAVYISSTFRDLEVHREKVAIALREAGHTVIAMEDYGARDSRPLSAVKSDIASASILVCIVAWRYGFVPPHDNPRQRSITELEYEHAAALGVPRLVFMLDETAPWPPAFIDAHQGERGGGSEIQRLREMLALENTVAFFETPDQLATRVASSVSKTLGLGRRQGDSKALGTHTIDSNIILTQIAILASDPDRNYAEHLASALASRDWIVQDGIGDLSAGSRTELLELDKLISSAQIAIAISPSATNVSKDDQRRLDLSLALAADRTAGLLTVRRPPHGTIALPTTLQETSPGPYPSSTVVSDIEQNLLDIPILSSPRRLPIMVLAMTEPEVHELLQFKNTVHPSWPTALSTVSSDLPNRYGKHRADWRPFQSSSLNIDELLKEAIGRFNRRNPTSPLVVQKYSLDLLVDNSDELGPLYHSVVANGCLVVLDDLILLSERHESTLRSIGFDSAERISVVSLSPLGIPEDELGSIIKAATESTLAQVLRRFRDELDPQCELGIREEESFRRWLYKGLPSALDRISRRAPDQDLVGGFVEREGLRPSPGLSELLFGDRWRP